MRKKTDEFTEFLIFLIAIPLFILYLYVFFQGVFKLWDLTQGNLFLFAPLNLLYFFGVQWIFIYLLPKLFPSDRRQKYKDK